MDKPSQAVRVPVEHVEGVHALHQRYPRLTPSVYVQKAPKDVLQFQFRNMTRSSAEKDECIDLEGRRGARETYLCAVGRDHAILGELHWQSGPLRRYSELMEAVDIHSVAYLMLVTLLTWDRPPQSGEGGVHELSVLVYEPLGQSFTPSS